MKPTKKHLTPDLVTQSEAGRIVGLSRGRISQMVISRSIKEYSIHEGRGKRVSLKEVISRKRR